MKSKTIWLIIALTTLLSVDCIMAFNVPIMRQIIGSAYLLFVPGYLIINILKLNSISSLKKIILSLGLSISLMTFVGLFINSFYPTIQYPLSFTSLLVVLNVTLLVLIALAYKINIEYIDSKNIFQITNFNIKHKFTILSVFPMIFPLLAVLGTYIMNIWENNLILLFMLLLIPVYITLFNLIDNKKISNSDYIFSIWMISLCLLLMHGLTSFHIIGSDIHNEFYSFHITLTNLHWSVSQYYSSSNSVLSVTILPVILYQLTQINAEYIFKLLYALIGSFIPLGVYIISKKYIGNKYAFFAALFYTFQVGFIYNIMSSTKTLIAIFFFTLALMLIFDDEIKEFNKKILFIIFLFTLVVSHYTTSYIFVVLLTFVALMQIILRLNILEKFKEWGSEVSSRSITSNFFTFGIIMLFIAVIFMWYSQLTSSPATNTVKFISSTVENLGNIFAEELRSQTQLAVVGVGVNKIPQQINMIIYDSVFAVIGLGTAFLLWRKNYKKLNIESEFIFIILCSAILLLLFLIVPYLSQGYGGTRLFTQVAVILATPFVCGAIALARLLRKPKWDTVFLLALLIGLFACSTYMPYSFFGYPLSPDYEKNGVIRGQSFIYEQDMITAEWLEEYKDNIRIYTDRRGNYVLGIVFEKDPYKVSRTSFFDRNQTINNGYVFLRKSNMQGSVYISGDEPADLKSYGNLFSDLDKIYDSNEGNVWLKQ